MRKPQRHDRVIPVSLVVAVLASLPVPAWAGQAARPPAPAAQPAQTVEPVYLRDRGTGLPLSMFGSYIRRGELVLYPFYEYYRDHDFEYTPAEFGAVGDVDYRGGYRAHEGVFLMAYGITSNVAVEFEVAGIRASFTKAPDDPSSLPNQIEESGLGDVEGQIRWRWRAETERRPEVFSYTEVVVPHAAEKNLIGTPGWEVKFGTGIIRGFHWGTLTARAAIEYSEASSSHFDLGEYAIEYLKRLSPQFRLYLGLEGTQDELSAIAEAQWHLRPGLYIKANIGRGLTSKATDWAPEVGILFTLPVR